MARLRSACMATSLASPPMRARVSRNSTTEPPAITATSIGSWRRVWMTSTAGAIREAPASRASRVRVSLVLGGAGSLSDTIEGCRAARPTPR
jgi:hypothetical protein